MKRIAITLVVFLLLGAIVNVAVAWGCAAWIVTPPTGMRSARLDITGLQIVKAWSVIRKQTVGATQISAMPRSSPVEEGEPLDEVLPGWSRLRAQMDRAVEREATDPTRAYVVGVLMQKAYGWPCLAMYWNWDGNRSPELRDRFSCAIFLPQRPFRPRTIEADKVRALPLGLIPLGFAINTVMYATIMWLLIRGPLVLRRFIRQRRGRCLKCGYDLGHAEHDVCPECGRDVKSPHPQPLSHGERGEDRMRCSVSYPVSRAVLRPSCCAGRW